MVYGGKRPPVHGLFRWVLADSLCVPLRPLRLDRFKRFTVLIVQNSITVLRSMYFNKWLCFPPCYSVLKVRHYLGLMVSRMVYGGSSVVKKVLAV